MKTLRDLNTASSAGITYTDDRNAGVYFDRPVGNVLPTFTKTGTTVISPFVPLINVVDIVDYASVNLQVTITLNSPTVGASETFIDTDLPSYMTKDETVANEITFGGFRSAADWSWLISNFGIDMNVGDEGEINYTVTITDDIVGYNIQYDITYQISSDSLDITGAGFAAFDRNATSNFVGPQVLDRGYDPTFTVTLTPSNTALVTTLSSAGTGGTSTFNSGTKVLTISGTRVQVNTHLSNLSITVPDVETSDFTITYVLTNDIDSVSHTVNQLMQTTEFLSAIVAQDYFVIDGTRDFDYNPLITNENGSNENVYNIDISADDLTNVITIGVKTPPNIYSTNTYDTGIPNNYAAENTDPHVETEYYVLATIDNGNYLLCTYDQSQTDPGGNQIGGKRFFTLTKDLNGQYLSGGNSFPYSLTTTYTAANNFYFSPDDRIRTGDNAMLVRAGTSYVRIYTHNGDGTYSTTSNPDLPAVSTNDGTLIHNHDNSWAGIDNKLYEFDGVDNFDLHTTFTFATKVRILGINGDGTRVILVDDDTEGSPVYHHYKYSGGSWSSTWNITGTNSFNVNPHYFWTSNDLSTISIYGYVYTYNSSTEEYSLAYTDDLKKSDDTRFLVISMNSDGTLFATTKNSDPSTTFAREEIQIWKKNGSILEIIDIVETDYPEQYPNPDIFDSIKHVNFANNLLTYYNESYETVNGPRDHQMYIGNLAASGDITYSSGNDTLSISGTKATVNACLASLDISVANTATTDDLINITYTLDIDGVEKSTRTQTLRGLSS